MIAPEDSRLPIGPVALIAAWMLIYHFVFACCFSYAARDDPVLPLLGWSFAGLLSGWATIVGWLTFTDRPSPASPTCEIVADSRFRMALVAFFFLTPIVVFLSPDAMPKDVILASYLLLIVSVFAIFWLSRHYARLRILKPFAAELAARKEAQLSISAMLILTGMTAISLAVGRYFLSNSELPLLTPTAIGAIVGSHWMATALWILGRIWSMPLSLCMTMIECFVVLILAEDADGVFNAGIIIASLQIHLICFLAIMRAAEYRFGRRTLRGG